MTGLQSLESGLTRVPLPRGMRVVLFDENEGTRASVRCTLDEDPGFVLAGEARDWRGCEALLERAVPELLIACVTQIPRMFLNSLSPAEFPVLVGLRAGSDRCDEHAPLYDSLGVPPEPQSVRSLLGRVRREIYRRKADELSLLLQRYVESSGKAVQYLSKLKVVDENQEQELEMEDVLLITADGNYVRVHTGSKSYEIRETMTGISAKLDPLRFVRLHRSFIVNLSHVPNVSKDNPAVVKLSNGTEVPIGPNYREQFESVIDMRNRLNV